MIYNNVMEPSLFTKIIQGVIPCHKIYEDELSFAFLDIHPVQPGHVLVIPKSQVEFVWDLNSVDYYAVMEATKKIALRMRDVMQVPYVHARIVGTDVPHAHVHLIPFTETSQLRHHPDTDAEPNHEVLAAIAKKLAI